MQLIIKIQECYHSIPVQSDSINSNRCFSIFHTDNRTQAVLNQLQTKAKFTRNNLISLCETYSDIFHLENEKLTANNFFKYSIKIKDSQPVYVKNYRTPHMQKIEVNTQVDKLLKDGLIQRSIAPYNSPTLLVPKKSTDGKASWRLCIDYRSLNKSLIADSYPLPRMDEILDGLGQNQFFSTIDLAQGFHQIPLSDESKDFTTFSTSAGSFKWNVLPFGLKVSPSAFARMIHSAFAELIPNVCFVYLDDIIILGKTEEEHLNNLQLVFETCKHLNLKLNPKKCFFFQSQVTYLGHRCTSDGVLPDPAKDHVIRTYPRPDSKEATKRFVAFANYFRRFIKNFSTLAEPLNRLTRKSSDFIWSNQSEQAFQFIKSTLLSPQILKYPDFTKVFTITTDASKVACGAILSQEYDGLDMPISYCSKAFTKGESNKSTIEQELLAIYYAIKNFRPYVYGTFFKIKCDHKPLVYLFSLKDPSSRLTRIRLELEEYDFHIEHIKGQNNVAADALSRITIEELKELNVFVHQVLPITRSVTRAMQSGNIQNQSTPIVTNEPQLKVYEPLNINKNKLPRIRTHGVREILQRVNNAPIATMNVYKSFKAQKPLISIELKFSTDLTSVHLGDTLSRLDELTVGNNIKQITLSLNDPIFDAIEISDFKTIGNACLKNTQILLTKTVINITDEDEKLRILTDFHNNPIFGGHPGQKRLLAKISAEFQWKGMRKDVAHFINNCHACKVNKPNNSNTEQLCLTPTPQRPFEIVIIDTVGPLFRSANNNTYVVTAICDLTKYVITIPVPNKEARTVAQAILDNIILIYGPMKKLLSDKGTEYINQTLSELCTLMQIQKVNSTAYHHETLGSIERNHRLLNEYLRTYLSESHLDWEQLLKYFTYCYNVSPHSSFDFNYTPFELIFSKKPPNFNSTFQGNVDPLYNIDNFAAETKYRLQLAFKHAKELLEKSKMNNKLIFDRKSNPLNIKIGDKVKILDFTRHKILDPIFKGPFTVLKDEGFNLILKNDNNNKTIEIHKNNVRKY